MTAGNSIFVSVKVITGTTTATTKAADRPRGTLWSFGGFLALAVLLPFGIRVRRSRGLAILFLSAVLALSSLGCGVTVSGGKLSTPVNPAPVNATPGGSYALSISATSTGIKRTTLLSLTVD